MKSQGKTEVPISFSLVQGYTEMENLQKYKLMQEFLCRIAAALSPKSSVLSSQLSQPLIQTFSSGMFCRSHHQSKVKKCSFSKIFTRLLLSAVGGKSFLPGMLDFVGILGFFLSLALFILNFFYYFYSFCLNVRN